MAQLTPPEHWVFAYGSLMWDPGFPVAEIIPARIDGYGRKFCMTSVVYRGTETAPGLVLALDEEPGSYCIGMALRVADSDWPEAYAGLHAREMMTYAYHETYLPTRLDGGRMVDALAYVVRHDHSQYAGILSPEQQAQIISGAVGQRGPNYDYLFNTTLHLRQLGMADPDLETLATRVRELLAK